MRENHPSPPTSDRSTHIDTAAAKARPEVGIDLAEELRRAGVTDVLGDATSRAAWSSDASLYRVVPTLIVRPRHTDDVLATLAMGAAHGIPLTARGAGTSIAGNAVGEGIVLDFSRHCGSVLDISVEEQSATVEAGTVHAVLQRAALAQGLRYGPDPSSHTRCTIGGMIGNNACGTRAMAYGRTSDTLRRLTVATAAGRLVEIDRDDNVRDPFLQALAAPVQGDLGTVRTEFGRFSRQVSGYSLEHLLPERFNAPAFFAGTEGTLGIVTQATVDLVHEPAQRMLLVLGFPDIGSAGDVVPTILKHHPTAVEGIDARIVDAIDGPPSARPVLPAGSAWLFVEVIGDSFAEALSAAQAVTRDLPGVPAQVVPDPAQAGALWRIREDGAGRAGRSPRHRAAHSGWEDAAVPPERLGSYLRAFDALLDGHDLTGLPYGHFGDGCLHIRVDFPLDRDGGLARYRGFLTEAADLVAAHGGSFSGEHGDGRARSELLPKMYSPQAMRLFEAVKAAADPANLLNPGVVVDPRPLDVDVRVADAQAGARLLPRPALRLHDGESFEETIHRCTGVGKCRTAVTGPGIVMCPSFVATGEEKDSTRGRARVLQEMVNGSLVTGGWDSPEVHEALDVCLSCKGCASDCPTGIDVAAYKAEALHQKYRGKLRPASHYVLGQLPRWLRLGRRMPRLANVAMRLADTLPGAKRLVGVDSARTLPRLASTRHTEVLAQAVSAGHGEGKPAVVFVDTFTASFAPEVADATLAVLRDAGYAPQIVAQQRCCGLTWISTGQLKGARRLLRATIDDLAGYAVAGVPIVGIEPSCTAVLRKDALELLDDDATRAVAGATVTLAELLAATPGWSAPDLSGMAFVAQPHCHHHAVMGWGPDAQLLKAAGADLVPVGGCCGLAGNFGVERGHYEISVAIAEQQLLPAVRANPQAGVIADGFSCRTQLKELAGVDALHLAQVLTAGPGLKTE